MAWKISIRLTHWIHRTNWSCSWSILLSPQRLSHISLASRARMPTLPRISRLQRVKSLWRLTCTWWSNTQNRCIRQRRNQRRTRYHTCMILTFCTWTHWKSLRSRAHSRRTWGFSRWSKRHSWTCWSCILHGSQKGSEKTLQTVLLSLKASAPHP